MQNRNLDEINDEIFRIKSIINPMEDYLSNHPDDLSVQANVDVLDLDLDFGLRYMESVL